MTRLLGNVFRFRRQLAITAISFVFLGSACGGPSRSTPSTVSPTQELAASTASPAATSVVTVTEVPPTATTVSTPFAVSSPVQPASTSPAATAPAASIMTITNADFGRSLAVRVGTLLVLAYETGGLRWTDRYDSRVLQPAGTGQLRAASQGQTALSSEGRPICQPGQLCPQFIRAFHVTIIVQA